MAGDNLDSYQGASCGWADLPCHLSSLAEWFKNLLLWLPRKIFEWFTDGMAELMSQLPAIPGAEQMISNAQALASISGVAWVLDLFLVAYGFKTCVSAYFFRFGIRRMPFLK